MWVGAGEYQSLWEGEEGFRDPETGLTGGCKPTNMGAGNWTLISCKSSIMLLIVEPSLQAFQ